MITIKSEREIEIMRKSCILAAQTLDMIGTHIKPGVSTEELNTLCHDFIVKHGAYPAPLNYKGFPKSICTSVNEVVCHGIPNKKHILKDGDIVNVDVTALLDGFHGDTNRTYYVGTPSEEARKLVEFTEKVLHEAIGIVKPGIRIGDIGHLIQTRAEAAGYGVVREFTGHGIGRQFHEAPSVPHYGQPGKGPKLRKGMTFTIEPMINLGRADLHVLSDGWTAVTNDGKISAQFEHTLAVTDSGCEILTLSH
ncbi:type I methionyl aminopeptidase [bacterium (Candidatus Blackallbacteria) CG17_big_fil_post_rev_8_21_14_2_50_48_46]|uniref:Methionine aminopeptidase n=1 Tax=bacterium (Candidatus Blackallbacteria) CG17_big_fil_post_rev_8_21_14_2_50_48_46 TaxID=2014261 RepID=A0A2M7GBD9_9BACT|nr:MAG: type I methionyl aminopeptidase [bacterium (Candidatus Blackallbacteria) CG18_big_fil_WC_8_21_14_2_50_49_26]PIW19511.1 MAG: type I methionyl aminopeptidase [bacterium (Candidatus Blackallbacteria) CG17_big_fil_post_rev_8_21_14_2_50_48_46]PIW48885.1 MAG: type I methionyl aminopeptidase [bacterium (Candidatus Blackallbacteria) CG13_big_fil_rev_8_21_14_2_50_49_14]